MSNFEITKKEILASIIIVSVMLFLGVVIHGNINEKLMLEYQQYNTALQIDNASDLFVYGMETNIGNAFVYGDLKAVNTVTYPEIKGEYSYIIKVKEKYTQHTRTVTKTRTVDGKTQTYTETEVYWTWDEVDRWSKQSTKITFLDVEFDYGTIGFPNCNRIDTQDGGYHIRYVYYASPAKCTGTLYTKLENGTINSSRFFNNRNIDQTIEELKSGWQLILFWILWTPLIVGCVIGFCYFDNKWIEDR